MPAHPLVILLHSILLIALLQLDSMFAQIAPTPADATASAANLSALLYLPLISHGTMTSGVPLDVDAPDFDAAVDNQAVEAWPVDDEPALDPAALIQASALLDGAGSRIDSSEDYRALGYPDGRKIVRNSQGDLYTAYRKKLNGRYRIFVAASTDGGNGWQILGNGPVENVGGYTQRVPALAIDEQDRLHLVWYGNDAANGNPENSSDEREIKYSRSTPTTGGMIEWTAWRNLYDGQSYRGQRLWQEHPTLTVQGDALYVAWESAERGLGEIKVLHSADGGETWGEVVTVQPSTQIYFSRPTIVATSVAGQPVLLLVAYGSVAGTTRLYWSRSDDQGRIWTKWVSVAATKADQRHATMAVDAQGQIHVAWRQVSGRQTILRYRRYDPADRRGKGRWLGAPQTIAAVKGNCLFFPSIAVHHDATLWVIWTQSSDCSSLPNDDPKSGRIYAATALVSKRRWSKPMALTTVGAQLYGSLRRSNHPAHDSGIIDIVWLDASASPIDSAGHITCAENSCVLNYTSLAP